MKSTVVTVAAFALLLLGCLKPQPAMVEAPVVINIPPMSGTVALMADPPVADSGPRLVFAELPPGWDMGSRQKESITLWHHENVGASISAHIEDVVSTDPPDREAEQFHRDVDAALVKNGIVASSYMTFAGPNAEFVVVRYASEMGCGTSAYARPPEFPRRFIVVEGGWPCDVDVENDAAIHTFMYGLKILTGP